MPGAIGREAPAISPVSEALRGLARCTSCRAVLKHRRALGGFTLTHVGIGLTFGLVVMAMIYAVGDVSGAHLNPAITFISPEHLMTESMTEFLPNPGKPAIYGNRNFK